MKSYFTNLSGFSKLLPIVISLFLINSSVFAANPTLNMQGVVRNESNAAVTDGTYSITFHMYDALTGGNEVWNETQSSVKITNGVYSTQLGIVKSLSTLGFDKTYYVAVAVNGGSISSPRIPLSIAPQALAVAGANNVFPGSGNVLIGRATSDTEGADNALEIRNGNIELQNDDQDAQIRFHDPGQNWFYIGTDKSDNNAFKIGTGATVGSNDYLKIETGGNVNVAKDILFTGAIKQDFTNANYDLWIQGGSGSTVGSDERNLAILGQSSATSDKLIFNWNSEYKQGVEVQSDLNITGKLNVNNSAPIVIRKYKSNETYKGNPKFNYYGRTVLSDFKTSEWSAAIVGFHLEGDWEENKAGADMLRFKMVMVDGVWNIECYERHNSMQYGEVDVMFIKKQLVDDQR